jgi:protein TonB
MSKDHKPSNAPPSESLEDVVYRPSIAGDSKEMQGTNPLIAIPTAIITYTCVALLTFFVATRTEAGKRAVEKTLGVILDVEENKIEDDEPPPPPPPPTLIAALVKVEVKDTPPPPPISDQETIPDDAPKVIPTIDYSKAFARQEDGGASGGVIGGTIGSGSVISSGQQNIVANITFSQMKALNQPPFTYPAMAQRARVQGTVIVEITVGPDGVPRSAVAKSGPQLLHAHAIDYAMKWRFQPYMVDGHAQAAKFPLTIIYKL